MTEKARRIVFSVDLEPNKDGSLDGIRDAMDWFNRTIPRGTVYATYRIARDLPDVIAMLAETHEIAVHVHPQEFGHKHDQFAELSTQQQRELITRTRRKLMDAAGLSLSDIVSFRAGRHSASEKTFSVLAELGFQVDASINVRYTDYLPTSLTESVEPFRMKNGLLELPTTYYCPSILSRVGIRVFPQRTLTATASTLRLDSRVCSGERALQNLFSSVEGTISMYMHPYDATKYHSELENNGAPFRRRVEEILLGNDHDHRYYSSSDLLRVLPRECGR